jgi:hypothetical protein
LLVTAAKGVIVLPPSLAGFLFAIVAKRGSAWDQFIWAGFLFPEWFRGLAMPQDLEMHLILPKIREKKHPQNSQFIKSKTRS